jgi:hypothetical protein
VIAPVPPAVFGATVRRTAGSHCVPTRLGLAVGHVVAAVPPTVFEAYIHTSAICIRSARALPQRAVVVRAARRLLAGLDAAHAEARLLRRTDDHHHVSLGQHVAQRVLAVHACREPGFADKCLDYSV